MTRARKRSGKGPSTPETRTVAAGGARVLDRFPAAAGLVLLVLAAFAPAFGAGFLWDDNAIFENPVVVNPGGLADIWLNPRANTFEDHYWPMVYTTFYLEYRIWGGWAPGYHAVNIVLHAINAVLVWRLLAVLALPGAWVAAAVFAVHPVRVESVAWAIERKDVLSGLFALLSVLAYLRFERERRGGLLGVSVVLYALAVLSKSIAVTLPAVLLGLAWYQRGRIARGDLLGTAPHFAVGAVLAAFQLWFVRTGGGDDFGHTPAHGILIAGRAFWFYLEKTLLPVALMPIYPRWEISPAAAAQWIFPAAAVTAGIVAFALRGRIGRGPAAAIACMVIILGPVIGFLEFGFMRFSFVADRFNYLAAIGPTAAIVCGIALAAARRDTLARMLPWVAAVCIGLLAVLTFRQAALYRSPLRFWQAAAARNPQAPEARHQHGLALAQSGDLARAEAELQEAIGLDPNFAEARHNLALALLMGGNEAEAETQVREALRLKPEYAEGLHTLGIILAQRGRPDEAIPLFEEALRLKPHMTEAMENLDIARRAARQ